MSYICWMVNGRRISPWLLAALLTLPVWLCFLVYFAKAREHHVAIGFFQDDNPLYISYARQYLDQDQFHLFYSNPFNESGNYPKIYFQLQNFWYALQLKVGIPPGWVMLAFTLVCSFIFFRIMLALIDYLFPESRNRLLISLLLAWGGGLLFIASIPASCFKGLPAYDRFDNWFLLDPAWGWWGLNLGRSLMFPADTEICEKTNETICRKNIEIPQVPVDGILLLDRCMVSERRKIQQVIK